MLGVFRKDAFGSETESNYLLIAYFVMTNIIISILQCKIFEPVK